MYAIIRTGGKQYRVSEGDTIYVESLQAPVGEKVTLGEVLLVGSAGGMNDPAQIRPALERAVASATVACVNVMLDPDAPAASGAQGYAI